MQWSKAVIRKQLRASFDLLVDRKHGNAPLGGLRCLSQAQTTYDGNNKQGKSLKDQLRNLYKLVHPDLFHNLPLEKAANEKSFKLLQEYLTAAEDGVHFPPRLYSFEFYLRNVRGTASGNGGEQEFKGGEQEFKKVQISLPPPARAATQGGALPRATLKSLGRLLAACGLEGDIYGGISSLSGELRLSELFREAGERARQQEAAEMSSIKHLAVARNAVQLGRRVTVLLKPPLAGSPVKLQAEAVERLARALDMAPSTDLAGHTLVLGDHLGLDPATGHIWLPCWDSVHSWARHLAVLDTAAASSAKHSALLRHAKEAQVAQAMEVEMVFADDFLGPKAVYSEFLGSLEGQAEAAGAVGQGRFQSLPVRVVERGGKGAEFEVEERLGYVAVPVTAAPGEVWQYIEERGQEALRHRQKYHQTERRAEEMKVHVRRKLRLRHLYCSDEVSADRFLLCCSKLLRHSKTLMPLMEGLSLCIGTENKLPGEERGSVMQLKWNFAMNEL